MSLLDFPGKIINILLYLIFVLGAFSSLIAPVNAVSNATFVMYLVIEFFFICSLFNAVVQNYTFDKAFKRIIVEHKEMLLDISGLPLRWVVNFGIIRGYTYASAIIYSKYKGVSLAPIVNLIAEKNDFKKEVRLLNAVTACLVVLSVVLFLLVSLVVGVWTYL
jgi:hypothetical protein